jgi:hypothetical protein
MAIDEIPCWDHWWIRSVYGTCHQLKMWQISAKFLPQLLTNKKNQFLAPQTWV